MVHQASVVINVGMCVNARECVHVHVHACMGVHVHARVYPAPVFPHGE